ncbi:F-actin capping protein beta subunit [Trypanosoma grayi]|uniref:F-actin capping protein beta subunit n=1 Tax=Trypanosoma grayi TaxID=71804 RepID=UPI0004F47E5F|nr:F-actin capping protein beta subunit [Trypanosoma grayi]KEG13574.1 F-actin capping protein beta subunit [Trypanosoma grayi]
MDSADVEDAAVSLLARYPPRKGRMALESIVELCERKGTEAVWASINRQISPVETPWTIVVCPPAPTKMISTGPHRFIASEYNRVGDSYRCPLCNEYVSGGEFVGVSPGASGLLRQVESAANCAFAEYAKLYYGKECTTSVYTWECDSDESDVTMGIALMIKYRANLTDDVCVGDLPLYGRRGVWQSAHVGLLKVSTGSYRFQSSFYLDAFISLSPSQGSSNTTLRFNGSVASRLYCFEGQTAVTPPNLVDLIASIGEQVQSIENNFRGRLFEIYFGKAQFVAQSIRSTTERRKKDFSVTVGDAAKIPSPNGPQDLRGSAEFGVKKDGEAAQLGVSFAEEAGDGVHSFPQAEGAPIDAWARVRDDEGNLHYHNEGTDETARERPGNECSVLYILQRLHLAHSPEKYHRRMRKYFKHYDISLSIDTFLSLLGDDHVLELDDGSTTTALEFLVPSYGDRRKIQLYITRRTAQDA